MRTENTPECGAPWLTKPNVRKIALRTFIFWGIIWVLAPWLNRPVVQPIKNAWVLTGQGLASFPMWGYSLLIRLFGSITAVVVLQSLLGALATAALLVRLNCLAPRLKVLTTTLFVLALPWLSFMAFSYQMPISSAFMLLALLAAEMSLLSVSISWGAVAGVLFGFAQNFRSEWLLLPGTLLIVAFGLKRRQWGSWPSVSPLATCVGVALLLQMPWALQCYFHAGRISLSESNLGHVAFLGLGRLPSNPWNITPADKFAQETVTKAGLKCSSLSFQGSGFLKLKFLEAVCEDPAAYMKCIAARLWATVYYPFGFIPFAGTPAEERAVRKLVGMIKPMVARSADNEHQPTNNSTSKIRVGCMMLYACSQGVLIRAVSILGIIGFFVAMRKAPFRLSQPVILCLGTALAYRWGLNVALYDSGKYMTSVYLCYLPFAINSLSAIYRRSARWRSGGIAAFSTATQLRAHAD